MNLSRGIMRSTTGCRPADDLEREVIHHLGPRIALALRDLGERRQYVELRNQRCRALQT